MYILQPNGHDLPEDDQQQEYQEAEPHGPPEDEQRKEDVSVSQPNPTLPGISNLQITVREIVILLVAVGGFLLQWSQMSAQMSMVAHDVASLHQDVSSFAITLRQHIESPGHAVELERQTVVNSRLDDLSARLKALEASDAARSTRR